MKLTATTLLLLVIMLVTGCTKDDDPVADWSIIADHNSGKLSSVPSVWIEAAKENLHIAYSHSSHGSQLTDGMSGLVSFKGEDFTWNDGGFNNALDLHDYAITGDLGSPDRITWAAGTRTYLEANPDVNVIIWSWCGQVSDASFTGYRNLS